MFSHLVVGFEHLRFELCLVFGICNFDDFVKSPTSVLRCILRHCGVPVSTPHSSGFARLEFEAFYFVVRFPTFYGTINVESKNKAGFLLEMRRWTFDVECSLNHYSDSCLLTSFFVSFSAHSAVQFFRGLVLTIHKLLKGG